jgi:Icc protein
MSVVLIAQLTDTHVVDPDADGNVPDEVYVDNNGRLVSAVASLNAEVPAMTVVLGTGDLTNWARPGEYDRLAELLAPLAAPFLALPGNHDDRDLLRATFPETPWIDAEHASWVTTVGEGDERVRIVGLDSTDPGEPGAAFDDDREAWLRAVLGEPHDGVTLLALHHPPFATGVGWMDASGFIGLPRLEAVLVDHPVAKVVCGHFHRPVSSMIAGIPVQVGLSTVQHVDLDLAPGAGVSLIDDPIGYQIHRIAGSSIVTHIRYIETGHHRIVPSWADDF